MDTPEQAKIRALMRQVYGLVKEEFAELSDDPGTQQRQIAAARDIVEKNAELVGRILTMANPVTCHVLVEGYSLEHWSESTMELSPSMESTNRLVVRHMKLMFGYDGIVAERADSDYFLVITL